MQDQSTVSPTAIERVPVKSLTALFGGLCAFGVADQAEANPGAKGPAGPPAAKKNADGPKAAAATPAPAAQPAPPKAAAPTPAPAQPAAPQPQAAPPPQPAAAPQPAPKPAAPQPAPQPQAAPPPPAAPKPAPKRSQRPNAKKQAEPQAAAPATQRDPAVRAKRAQRRMRKAVPKRYARIYRRAAKKYDLGPGGWSYLAALGHMGSDHGRAKLPGVKRGVSSDGCCTGPMQFMPETWERFGVDANGNGRTSPYEKKDAIHGFARFLNSLQTDGAKWRKTIYDANPSSEYVSEALQEAASLRRKSRNLREAREALEAVPAPAEGVPAPAQPGPPAEPEAGDKPRSNGEDRPAPARDRPVKPKPVPGYRPSQQARADIPPEFLGLYRDAAADFDLGPRGWAMLAGIGSIETDHGRLDAEGVDSGENPWGAGGPMQFLSDTWDAYAVDGDDDGDKDRYDPADAIHSAANYLDDSGAPNDWDSAIYAYNHADWYVNDVKQRAAKYRGTRVRPEPEPQPQEPKPTRPEAERERDKYNAQDVVDDPNIELTDAAEGDFAEGEIDKRVVNALGKLSDDHELAISVAKSGHDKYTTSGSVSNHWYGRAVDIYSVDGRDCTGSDSEPCATLAEELVDLGPTEIGYAYDVDGAASDAFGDPEGHSDHVHLGYD